MNDTTQPPQPRILIVDDDHLFRYLLRDILSERFEYISEANDGVSALEIITDHRPDIVLADIDMPRMGGLELAEQLRRAGPSPAILFISGAGVSADELRCRRLDDVPLIAKPLTDEQRLFQGIEAALARPAGQDAPSAVRSSMSASSVRSWEGAPAPSATRSSRAAALRLRLA